MGMAKHTDIRLFAHKKGSSILRELPAFVQDMTDGDAEACQIDHRLGRKPTLFIIIVDVARDGGNWCDPFQLFDHGPIANVSGVENVIDACKMSSNRRIEQAMGVGNDPNPNGSPLAHGAATGCDTSEACTCFQSNVNGSGNFFGKAASSAFYRRLWRRSTPLIIDVGETHCGRGSALSLICGIPILGLAQIEQSKVIAEEEVSSPSQPYSIRERMKKPV